MSRWKWSLVSAGLLVLLAMIFISGIAVGGRDQQLIPLLRSLWHFGNLHSRPTAAGEGSRFRLLPADRISEQALTGEQAAEIQRLQSIGYLSGSTPAVAKTSVTRHAPRRAYQGLNLYTDGHRPQATLMDMDGKVLHQWSYPFHKAFPDSDVSGDVDGIGYWRRVALTERGDLFAIYEGQGLIKLDSASNLIWAYPGLAHHDMDIRSDGTVYVLTRKAEIVPELNDSRPTLLDFVVVLDKNGEEQEKVSVLETIRNSDYVRLARLLGDGGDAFHTNTLEVLDGRLASRLPSFRRGNVLISSLHLNIVGIIDMERRRMAWALSGLWGAVHQPTILHNGNMMLFDNNGDRGKSRVIEFDPFTQEVLWAYRGGQDGFFSPTCGSNQRLPNGNTLITETDFGRAFEVTPNGEIVWEFFTPNRAGEQHEYIASLFEVLRLPPDFPVTW